MTNGKRTPPDVRERILALCRIGASVREIAVTTRTPPSTVHGIIRTAQMQRPGGRHKLAGERLLWAVAEYKAGTKLREIARNVGVSATTLSAALDRENVPRRGKGKTGAVQ